MIRKWDSSHNFEQINILCNYSDQEWKIYVNDFNPKLENVFNDTMNMLGIKPDKYYIHSGTSDGKYATILEVCFSGKAPNINHDLIRSKLELLTTYESTTE